MPRASTSCPSRSPQACGSRGPGLDAPIDRFGEAIAAAVGDASDPAEVMASLAFADLWLATACAAGLRPALDELDRILASLRPTLGRMGAGAELIDELIQGLRTHLLVATPDRPARVAGYRGRGDLRSWLKVALVRDAVRALRRGSTTTDDDELDALMDPAGDPELVAMRSSYRAAFRDAFARALACLTARDRNLLRHHLIDGLAIDEIGALYRVHRSTAARWLVRIREQLHVATRAELMNALAVSPHELDSVLRLIRSQLDASIARGLGPQGAQVGVDEERS